MSVRTITSPLGEPHIEKIPNNHLGVVLSFLEPKGLCNLEACSQTLRSRVYHHKQAWKTAAQQQGFHPDTSRNDLIVYSCWKNKSKKVSPLKKGLQLPYKRNINWDKKNLQPTFVLDAAKLDHYKPGNFLKDRCIAFLKTIDFYGKPTYQGNRVPDPPRPRGCGRLLPATREQYKKTFCLRIFNEKTEVLFEKEFKKFFNATVIGHKILIKAYPFSAIVDAFDCTICQFQGHVLSFQKDEICIEKDNKMGIYRIKNNELELIDERPFPDRNYGTNSSIRIKDVLVDITDNNSMNMIGYRWNETERKWSQIWKHEIKYRLSKSFIPSVDGSMLFAALDVKPDSMFIYEALSGQRLITVSNEPRICENEIEIQKTSLFFRVDEIYAFVHFSPPFTTPPPENVKVIDLKTNRSFLLRRIALCFFAIFGLIATAVFYRSLQKR